LLWRESLYPFSNRQDEEDRSANAGLAGNNAADNGARGVHGAEIGRAARRNQVILRATFPNRETGTILLETLRIKKGRSEDRPIALEANET